MFIEHFFKGNHYLLKPLSVTLCTKLLGIFLLNIIIFNNVVAQSKSLTSDFVFNQWTVNEGLPVNEISYIAQTQEGYMWLATFDGLVRFDGDQFTIFNTANTSAFSTNRFANLLVDRDNNLWIVTDKIQNKNTLIKYHRGQFTAFGPEDGLTGNINVQLSSEGNVLVGSGNGAFFYDGKTLKSFGDQLKGKSVRNIANDSEGRYWFSTDQGVFQYKDDNWVQLTEEDGLDSRNIFAVHVTQNGKVWIASGTMLSLWENGALTIRLDLAQPIISSLVIHENPLKSGEIRLVTNKTYMSVYKNDQLLPYPSLENQGIHRGGLTSTPSGVTWSFARTKVFREGKLVYTTEAYINHLFCDKLGNIWVAQSNGLVQLKPKLIKAYENISKVYSIIEDHEEEIWAIQNIRELVQLKGDSFQKSVESTIAPVLLIYSLCVSSDSLLWIGSTIGVFRWDKKAPPQLLIPFGVTDSVPAVRGIKARACF